MESETPSDVPRPKPGQSTVPATGNSAATQRKSLLSSLPADSDQQSRVWVPDDSGKYVKRHSNLPQLGAVNKNTFFEDSAEYDPYKQRKPEAPISNCFALLHIVKGSVGYGIWSMPNAFQTSGLVLSTVFLVVSAAFISYCFNLLMQIEYRLCKRRRVPYMNYGESVQYAMEEGPDWIIRISKKCQTLTNALIATFQCSACMYYITSSGHLAKNLVDFYHCDVVSIQVMISSLVILCFLVVCVPTLRTYSYFTALAFTLIIVCLGMISVHMFQLTPAPEARTLIGHPGEWRQLIASTLVAMQSVGVTCSTERSMANPGDFRGVCGVFNLAMTIIVLLYWFMGTSGYLVYGEGTKGNIMENMSMHEPKASSDGL